VAIEPCASFLSRIDELEHHASAVLSTGSPSSGGRGGKGGRGGREKGEGGKLEGGGEGGEGIENRGGAAAVAKGGSRSGCEVLRCFKCSAGKS